MRAGIGYDVHPLVTGRRLILGGMEVPFEKGLDGHSDADVLVHAVMDALLGAAGLKDIGAQFPSHDKRYKDISSLVLLGEVRQILAGRGFRIVNIDATIVAQHPRLAPYMDGMRAHMSRVLELPVDRVSVKATTSEGLGFPGRGEGMAAMAIASLEESR